MITLFRYLKYKWKFPKGRLHRKVRIRNFGGSISGSGWYINEGANIVLPSKSLLILGNNVYVGRNTELSPSKNLTIGKQTTIQDRSVILGNVQIGANCLISYNVYISSGRHYFDLHPEWLIRDQDKKVHSTPELLQQHNQPVSIGEDCLIGVNVVIMPGIIIGKGAIIGAGAVVTHNIPPYSIVAGSPAKTIRKRLEFTPPKELYPSQNLFPYFYSGFSLSQDNINDNGLLAECNFSLCMDIASGSSIVLLAKFNNNNKGYLVLNGKKCSLSGDFEELKFELDNQDGDILTFSCHFEDSSSKSSTGLILRKAYIL